MKIDERLAKMETILGELKVQFGNHLDHHFRYSFYAWTTVAGLLIYLFFKK
jgi:hypothetical protein